MASSAEGLATASALLAIPEHERFHEVELLVGVLFGGEEPEA